MPQLYKHNKGKWLLPSVVSKNTAGNEEKWWSLRRSPVMCHWPTLSLKINHKRGALWLRHGHPWSINPPPPLPPPAPLCFTVSLTFLQKHSNIWHKLNQHREKRGTDEMWSCIFLSITSVSSSNSSLFEELTLGKKYIFCILFCFGSHNKTSSIWKF